jgi:aryl-alcohol dehydrogenase-like predicted oxidoreductase
MEYVRLGSTGLKVSRLCLGCMSYGSPNWRPWVLDEAAARPFIREALDGGINFFDTADVYSLGGSETVLGNILKDFGVKRSDLVIATKVNGKMGEGPNDKGLSRKHIMESIDASLQRLRTDFVDLYQIHRWDDETPIEETLEALNDLVRAGKVRYLGASSMFAWQFSRALHLAERRGWSRFVAMQNHYNLVYREEEREMNPLCRAEGIGLIPWSPLARGFLAGNRRAEGKTGETLRAKSDEFAQHMYFQADDFAVAERVKQVAAKRGVKPVQVALAWVATRPGVTAPIIGATKPGHLADAFGALKLTLDEAEVTALEEPYRPHKVLGHG